MGGDELLDASIVICTHNRAPLLDRALASIGAADKPAGTTVETVVVANACDDETASVVHRWRVKGKVPGLRLVEEPTLGKSHALMRGIGEARGGVLVFVDDDHRVGSNWLRAVVEEVEASPKVLCFCGRILPDWDGTEPAWARGSGRYGIRPFPVPTFDLGDSPQKVTLDGFLPGGGNLFLRRELLARVPPFDACLGPRGHDLWGGEDMAFVVNILNAGQVIHYQPRAVQYHYVDPRRLTWRYVIEKSYKRGSVLPQCRGLTYNGAYLFGAPRYLFFRVVSEVLKAATAIDVDRRRYYAVRAAGTLGEIVGHCRWDGRRRTV